MEQVTLDRFPLEGFLGSGSDYEVHAATDTDTGKLVVVRRPNPDYISRKLHHGVDRLSEQLIDVHQAMDSSVPYLANLVGYTAVSQHDGYFGDSLKEEYRVLVEERAQGFPLVGDLMDKFKGVPIGLGQNLFCLHPLVPAPEKGHFAVHRQLMDVEEAFQNAGHLLLDMRPQNIYFDPVEGRITVIDVGTIPTGGPAAQGVASMGDRPRDVHDFFAELLTFYVTPETPPGDISGYREPAGMRSNPNFDEHLDMTIRNFSEVEDADVRDAAVAVLVKVRERGYTSFGEFRRDFDSYLARVESRNEALVDLPDMVDVWRNAMELLSARYWTRFLFDPGADLACYRKA